MGKQTMSEVADKAHGIHKAVMANKALEDNLYKTLKGIAEGFGALVRTDCELCGDNPNKAMVPVELVLMRDGERVADNSANKFELELDVKNYGDCDQQSCEEDADCDACRECGDGSCQYTSCDSDSDCDGKCSCQDGLCKAAPKADKCERDKDCKKDEGCDAEGYCRSTCDDDEDCARDESCDGDGLCQSAGDDPDWLPIALGVLALMGLLLIVLGVLHNKKIARERMMAAQEEQRRREESERQSQQAAQRDAAQRQRQADQAQAQQRQSELE
ncbi:MAG: hypothetical protein QF464_24285, partial [Myxococcota bacterium]|nr:hypothetical protein [Myxococcota bacterium]